MSEGWHPEIAPAGHLIPLDHAPFGVPCHRLGNAFLRHIFPERHEFRLDPCEVVLPAPLPIQSERQQHPQQPREVVGHFVDIQ